MDLMDLHSQLMPVIEKAREAVITIYREEERFAVEYKADNSPLTLADQASNQIICEGLSRYSPEIPIISEENKLVPYHVREAYDYCWLVDPLDGTKEFVKRNGEFTINVALIHKGRSIFGMVDIPVQQCTYYAMKGQGAFKQTGETSERIKVRNFRAGDDGLFFVCSRSHLSEETQKYINRYSYPELVSKGSALKFLVIAEGCADIYPRLGPTMEWDTAAAQIILEEAGGKVLRYEDRAPLTYNKADLLNPYFIAAGQGELS